MMNLLQINKNDIAKATVVTISPSHLPAGSIRLKVDHFALTANNVTYATFGKAMHYWDFYPQANPDMGAVPVWGFATVTESKHADVSNGDQFYGYFTAASHVDLEVGPISSKGFICADPHRRALALVYNQYVNVASDPYFAAALNALKNDEQSQTAAKPIQTAQAFQSLLRPLYLTSWLINDLIQDQERFGAEQLVFSSASSKTAYLLAWLHRSQPNPMKIIGLTSVANRAFCESLGCYDQLITYDELHKLDSPTASLYVDFAGNSQLRREVHERLPNLKYDCSVGGTHIEQLKGAGDLKGPRPVLFFAPGQSKKRAQEWTPAGLEQRLSDSWKMLMNTMAAQTPPWFTIEYQAGEQALVNSWEQLVSNQLPASIARVHQL
jgi:Protein of unknown function (DUF2855)